MKDEAGNEKVADLRTEPVKDIFDISPEALRQIKSHLEMQGLAIPVSNLLGFSQIAAHVAPTVSTVESTTSTTYTDLATVGPTLTGLASGQYLVFFGFTGSNTVAGTATLMAVSVDGAAPVTVSTEAMTANSHDSSVVGFFTVSVTGDRVGGHEFKAKYKVDGSTGVYFYRRLAAFKFAN